MRSRMTLFRPRPKRLRVPLVESLRSDGYGEVEHVRAATDRVRVRSVPVPQLRGTRWLRDREAPTPAARLTSG